MAEITIRTFNMTPYQTIPTLSAFGLMRLIRDLNRAKPAKPNDVVVKAAIRMVMSAAALKALVLERVEGAGVKGSAAFKFDVCVDRFWGCTKSELEQKILYADAGLAILTKERRAELDLDHRIEMADVARELHARLFSDGLAFLQLAFPIQAEQMAIRLEYIHKSPHAAIYEELLGDGLLKTLDVLQAQYDDMVHGRVTQHQGAAAIKELRHTAHRHATMYSNAVLLMLDDDDHSSLKVVMDALAPIKSARNPRRLSATEEVEEDEGIEGLDELDEAVAAKAEGGAEPIAQS